MFFHDRHHCLAHAQRAKEIGFKRSVEGVFLFIQNARREFVDQDAGVVHQNIDRAVLLAQIPGERVHTAAPGNVEFAAENVEPLLRQRPLRLQALLRIAAGQYHTQSVARELPGYFEADAPVGAGHQRQPLFFCRHALSTTVC